MKPPVLIIEAPNLDDKSIAKMHDFIHELLKAFEGYYYPQLLSQARYEKETCGKVFDDPGDEDPF